MIDNYFRSILPYYVGGLLKLYKKAGLTPNNLTWIGFWLALVAAFFVATDSYVAAFLMWWISRIFDGTDGIYARHTNQTSTYGAFLDVTLDMAAYSFMVVGFAISQPDYALTWTLMVSLYVLCITTALIMGELEKDYIKDQKRSISLGEGLAEAAETGVAYSIFLLFPSWISVTSTIWIVILIYTVYSRLKAAKNMVKNA